MDEAHFVTALRYIALNPVRAKLVPRVEDWRWASTRALLSGQDDHVVTVAPALERVGNFAAFLGEEFDEELTYAALRRAESIGSPAWLAQMEERLGRALAPQKRGPKVPFLDLFSREGRNNIAQQHLDLLLLSAAKVCVTAENEQPPAQP